jgi:hypothetical protein
MSKDAVFTMKLEPMLRAEFMAAVEAADRPASQVVRDFMRDFIQHQREAKEYDAYLRSKVAAARGSMRARKGRSNDQIETKFAKRRTLAMSRM